MVGQVHSTKLDSERPGSWTVECVCNFARPLFARRSEEPSPARRALPAGPSPLATTGLPGRQGSNNDLWDPLAGGRRGQAHRRLRALRVSRICPRKETCLLSPNRCCGVFKPRAKWPLAGNRGRRRTQEVGQRAEHGLVAAARFERADSDEYRSGATKAELLTRLCRWSSDQRRVAMNAPTSIGERITIARPSSTIPAWTYCVRSSLPTNTITCQSRADPLRDRIQSGGDGVVARPE